MAFSDGTPTTGMVRDQLGRVRQVIHQGQTVEYGWNLLAELNESNQVKRTYLWGPDLSGTLQGAGGVGGLVAIQDSAQVSHFTVYDGNGNITGLIKASDGYFSAVYEFGPFGELVRSTGPMVKANPFRFSTKYTYEETELVYYPPGRYCSTSIGRWMSRDPIEEWGGLNLYGFVRNAPMSYVDRDGMGMFNLMPNGVNAVPNLQVTQTPEYNVRYVPPQQNLVPSGSWIRPPSEGGYYELIPTGNYNTVVEYAGDDECLKGQTVD